MSRPLRIEFAGALYHVTSRGDGREAIFLDDQDRACFLEVLGSTCEQNNWLCHAYCLMGNHYHLLLETPDANLSAGMRQLNGVYTQRFNRQHSRVGHVFQGRYKAILVQKQNYLLELCRYIVLNPVRARMVRAAKDWPWSSYRAYTGLTEIPSWLSCDWVLSSFSKNRAKAWLKFKEFVAEGKMSNNPWCELKQQVFLGDDAFVDEMQIYIKHGTDLSEIPKSQRRPPHKPLAHYFSDNCPREESIFKAYASGRYTQIKIAEYLGLHYSSISKILTKQRKNFQK